MQDINRLIGEYYAARQSYDNAKKIADDFDRARRDAERRLVDHMLENGINKLSLDDGTTPTLVTQVSIKVTQDNDEAIREWLRETEGDDQDYVVTVVHKPTVTALVKKLVDNGSEDTVPAFLELNQRPILRVTGWKSKE